MAPHPVRQPGHKSSKTGATRCQILRLKCTKFDCRWGSALDPAGGAYSAPQTLAVFKGPTSMGAEGEGEGKGRRKVGKEKGRGWEGMVGPPTGELWIRQ